MCTLCVRLSRVVAGPHSRSPFDTPPPSHSAAAFLNPAHLGKPYLVMFFLEKSSVHLLYFA